MEEPKEDKENDTQKMNRNGNPNVPRWWPVLPCTESGREVRDHCGIVYELYTDRKSKSTECHRGRPGDRARLRPQAPARFYISIA